MTMLVFLPARDAGFRWLRIDAGHVVEDGEGLPEPAPDIVAVAPADGVTLHWAELPARSLAQATAAARILAADASASPIAELHVAVGDQGIRDRPIGVVGVGQIRDWLASLAGAGIDPVALVPAPMLLPRPDNGYVRGIVGGECVVRGVNSAFADEARLTDLVTGDTPPVTIDRAALEAALVAAVAAPPLDLRQGPFARRHRFAIDWALVRRLGWLSVAIVGVTLAIALVQIAKDEFAADALERRAATLAATGLARGETVTDADRQLDERLVGVRGPGLGFSGMAAAVFAVVRGVQGTEVTALDFQPNGTLHLSVAVEREALATDLKRALEAAGFTVQAGVFQASGGRVTGDLTVTPS